MKRALNTLLLVLSISILFVACQKEVPVSSVSLSDSSITLVEGESKQLIATINPSEATNKALSWTSSDASVATVSDGLVTALKAGSTIITARTVEGGKSATCSITVVSKHIAVEGISLDKVNLSMYDDEEFTLTVTITPSNATEKTVTWKSSNEEVASVVAGKITAHKEGTTEITASIENVSAKCKVSVEKRIIHVESLKVATEYKRLKVGETFSIHCSVLPVNANNYKLTYSSDNESVASIDADGVVSAKNSGNATIIIKAEDKSATVSISVFRSDKLFYSYNEYDYGKYTSRAYQNDNLIYEATNLVINDLYVDKDVPILVATEHSRIMRSTIINNGTNYYLNDLDASKSSHIEASTYANNTVYSVVNYPLPITNGGYGLWVGLNKKYDISENGVLSDYSILNVFALTVVGNDIYACGSIREPVDANTSKSFPVIWKNGIIYKQFELDTDASFYQIVNANGKIYLLLAFSIGDKDYLSIWDENGKCYDVGTSYYASAGKLYYFNSKLYTAMVDNNKDGVAVLSVLEENNKLFEIDNVEVSGFALDYVEGDIYSLLIRHEKNGGNMYYSAQIFRNDIEEKTLIKPQMYPLYIGGIKAFAGD